MALNAALQSDHIARESHRRVDVFLNYGRFHVPEIGRQRRVRDGEGKVLRKDDTSVDGVMVIVKSLVQVAKISRCYPIAIFDTHQQLV